MILYVEQNNGKTVADPWPANGRYWFHELAPYLGNNMVKSQATGGVKVINPEKLKIAYCPSARKVTPGMDPISVGVVPGTANNAWATTFGDSPVTTVGEGSYGRNGWLYSEEVLQRWYGTTLTDTIRRPYYLKWYDAKSEVPVFADMIWINAWPRDNDLLGKGSTKAVVDVKMGSQKNGRLLGNTNDQGGGYDMGRACIDRHNMAINVSFVGGQVERVPLSKLWNLQWSRTFNRSKQITVPTR
jgi:hypothetical protein